MHAVQESADQREETPAIPAIHRGAIDQTTITTRSPSEVMESVKLALESMGVEMQVECLYKLRCVRAARGRDDESSTASQSRSDPMNLDLAEPPLADEQVSRKRRHGLGFCGQNASAFFYFLFYFSPPMSDITKILSLRHQKDSVRIVRVHFQFLVQARFSMADLRSRWGLRNQNMAQLHPTRPLIRLCQMFRFFLPPRCLSIAQFMVASLESKFASPSS
jgi:hypothetical protein